MLNGSTSIGVFDSGLGGMSVVDAIRRRLPDESIVYVADSQFAPYGEKRVPLEQLADALSLTRNRVDSVQIGM